MSTPLASCTRKARPLQRLHAVANAPIFSYTDAFFGQGIVGGPHVPVIEVGQQVAAVGVRILGGENAGSIKVPPVGMGAPKFDWRELRRWEISESRLPPGSIIFFRPPTAWEQYKTEIVVFLVALLLQTILILRLLYEHRLRRVAETKSLERADELAYMNRTATAGELSASIAHEVKQPLAAIVANASAALRWLGKQTPNIEEARLALKRMLDEGHRASQVIDEIRDMFRKNVHAREPVNVNALISETLLLVDHEIQTKRILVQTCADAGQVLAHRCRPHPVAAGVSEPRGQRDRGHAEPHLEAPDTSGFDDGDRHGASTSR